MSIPNPYPYMLEAHGPSIAAEMIILANRDRSGKFGFVVVTIAYDRANCRTFLASTLKQAFRLLSSVADSTRGKRYRKGEFAACIVTPENRVMNWSEAKAAIKAKANA